jgi:peptide/nickel transport system substrate-binding protein
MKKVLSIIFVGIFLILLFGISNINAEEKTLVFGRASDYIMDPAVVGDTESLYTIFTVYDQLVTRDEKEEIKPLLATSWEVSEDYKTYTFHLRKGVKFHDGTPFNAEAVKFSFDRITNLGKFASGAWNRIADKNSVEVVDDYTVRIHLIKPYTPWIRGDFSINPAYAIMSPTYVKKHITSDDPYAEKWMAYNECGTGPWKLVSWTKGQKIVFEKNKDYFGGDEGISGRRTPRTDKLVFQVFKDSSTGRLWLEKGDIDLAEKLSSDDLVALEKNSNIKIHENIPAGIVYLTFDVSKPPLNDENVRKAMAYAINYQELIDYAERGHGRLPRGMITEGTYGYNPERFQYSYDLEKAKEFMAKSNYPDGFTTKLLFSTDRNSAFQKSAVYIQNYLKKIGINVVPESLAFPTQLDICSKGDYGIALRDWIPFYPDPSETAGWFYNIQVDDSGWICSFWDDKEAMNNMEVAETLPDSPERYKLYDETDELAISKAIYVPLYQTASLLAARDNIKNFSWQLNLGIRFDAIEKD